MKNKVIGYIKRFAKKWWDNGKAPERLVGVIMDMIFYFLVFTILVIYCASKYDMILFYSVKNKTVNIYGQKKLECNSADSVRVMIFKDGVGE